MFNAVFTDYVLKGKTFKNRFVVPPMVTAYAPTSGKPDERVTAYYEARAAGGFGFIIVEATVVDEPGRGFPNMLGLWDDDQVGAHRDLVQRLHAHGALVMPQLFHPGRQTSKAVTGVTPVAPSALQCPLSPDMPRELSVPEIQELVDKFANAAVRAQHAGYDGIEIHGAHGYLIAQFMSAYSNKRVDEYGGDLRSRMRFALEIVRAIREKCGPDFIIAFRLSVDEYVSGGRTLEESKVVSQMLVEAGVDLLDISAGVYATAHRVAPSYYEPVAWLVDQIAEIKKVCFNTPVIAVGRIGDPYTANEIVASGRADFVALGRSSLAEAELPLKAAAGRVEDIRICLSCNWGCMGLLFTGQAAKCVINPELGREAALPVPKAAVSRRVAIVGAGPAGLEAAIYAAQAGHHVEVFEKAERAGGQLYLASIPPAKGDLSAFIRWQLTQLAHMKVPVHYGTEVKATTFALGEFDQILVATGAVPAALQVSGADGKNVVRALDVLAGTASTGATVVVVGGGQVGAETAHFLAEALKKVTLVEQTADIAIEEAAGPRGDLLARLEKHKVNVLVNTTVKKIKPDSIVLSHAGRTVEVPTDTVVVATGAGPENGLVSKLAKKGLPVVAIGDAHGVGNLLDATEQGYEAALAL